jgi:hypothetical protein
MRIRKFSFAAARVPPAAAQQRTHFWDLSRLTYHGGRNAPNEAAFCLARADLQKSFI